MAMRRIPDDLLQQAIDAHSVYGSLAAAARALGVPRPTLQHRLEYARQRGFKPQKREALNLAVESGTIPSPMPDRERIALQDRIRDLEAEIKAIHRDELTEEKVRDKIFGLAETDVTPPSWAVETPKRGDTPGTPLTLWSDWHWGEVVKPAQIGGINEYNLNIAKARLRRLVSKTISIAYDHMVRPDYPGIVVCLGGDMVSGDIHDELRETNELPSGPILIDLVSALTWALDAIADKFGQVWVVGVAGNHGRMSHRPRFKDRQFTNFDWVIYHLLRMQFAKDDRLSFLVPDGADAAFQVYGHRYLLTHGDNLGVKGGDGIIGSLGPIARGDFKIRNSNAAIGQHYDTLLMGHWHQYIPLVPQLLVNGSLKGYDEFAKLALRARPEPPKQALWFTHKTNGITSAWPVLCEPPGKTWSGEAVTFGMEEAA